MENSEARSNMMMISPTATTTAKDTIIKQPHTSIQLDESQEHNYEHEITQSVKHGSGLDEIEEIVLYDNHPSKELADAYTWNIVCLWHALAFELLLMV